MTQIINPVAVLVNDVQAQIQILSNILTGCGLKVQSFQSPIAALEGMNRNAPPILIVTDLQMPGIDGWRFCRLLRSPEYAPFNKVPILVIADTITGEEAERITADLGVNAFTASSVDDQKFREKVLMLLQGEQLQNYPRVLIVDDDEVLASILKMTFEMHGYHADIALTGRDAETMFKAKPYQFVILDHHLPDTKGSKLLVALKPLCPETVYLAMTGDSRPELALEWMKQGAAAFVSKPFDPQYLIELCVKARQERNLLRIEEQLELRTRELRASEEKHRILLDESPDPIFSFSAEGRYLYVNKVFAEGVGKERNQIIGKTIWEIFPKQEASQQFEALRDVFETGEKKVIEVCFEDQFYITTITPLKDAEGKVILAICSSKNITERKRAELAFRGSEERLRQSQKMESIGHLTGGIAHQFNNILTAMMMNISMTQTHSMTTEVSDLLQDLKTLCMRSSDLIQQLLAFSRQSVLLLQPLDLAEAVAKECKILDQFFGKNITVSCFSTEGIPLVNADKAMIEQVVLNLCLNARDAMKEGGRIRLELSEIEVGNDQKKTHDHAHPGMYVCISVIDTGCGMDERTMERLFEPFFTTKDVGQGIGLGLAMVFGIVHQHHGWIEVESCVGKGSVFRVYLPAVIRTVAMPSTSSP